MPKDEPFRIFLTTNIRLRRLGNHVSGGDYSAWRHREVETTNYLKFMFDEQLIEWGPHQKWLGRISVIDLFNLLRENGHLKEVD